MLRSDAPLDVDQSPSRGGDRHSLLAMDAIRDDDALTIYIDAPGIGPRHIEVAVEECDVVVTAERRYDDSRRTTVAAERSQGTFRRRIALDPSLDVDAVSATHHLGVLVLTVPFRRPVERRSIAVESGPPPGAG